MKDGYFLSPKKRDHSITNKNNQGITLTPIAANIYNLMLLHRIRPEIDPILRKNQNGFRIKRSTTGQIVTIRRILEGVKSKNLPATLLFIDFSKAFDSINRENMKDILIIYGIPTEIVNSIFMLYKKTCSMVRSPDGDTPFFNITTVVLQGDTLLPFLFIICLDYILKKLLDSNSNLGFTLIKRKSKRYPAVHITNINLLHNIEDTAKDIGLHINSDKTEYMCLKYENQINMKNLSGHDINRVE